MAANPGASFGWELDLGYELPMETVVIWSRTYENCKGCMKQSTVKLRSKHHSVLWEKKLAKAPMTSVCLKRPPVSSTPLREPLHLTSGRSAA